MNIRYHVDRGAVPRSSTILVTARPPGTLPGGFLCACREAVARVAARTATGGLYGFGSCYLCGLKNNRLRGTVVFYVWSFCKSVLFIFELLHKFFIQKLLL